MKCKNCGAPFPDCLKANHEKLEVLCGICDNVVGFVQFKKGAIIEASRGDKGDSTRQSNRTTTAQSSKNPRNPESLNCKTCKGEHPCYIEDETPGSELGTCVWVCPVLREKKKEGLK